MGRKKKAQVAAGAAGDVSEYEVLSPLHHDGDRYDIGETVELSSEQAATLLHANVVKPAEPENPAEPTEGTAPPSA